MEQNENRHCLDHVFGLSKYLKLSGTGYKSLKYLSRGGERTASSPNCCPLNKKLLNLRLFIYQESLHFSSLTKVGQEKRQKKKLPFSTYFSYLLFKQLRGRQVGLLDTTSTIYTLYFIGFIFAVGFVGIFVLVCAF